MHYSLNEWLGAQAAPRGRRKPMPRGEDPGAEPSLGREGECAKPARGPRVASLGEAVGPAEPIGVATGCTEAGEVVG